MSPRFDRHPLMTPVDEVHSILFIGFLESHFRTGNTRCAMRKLFAALFELGMFWTFTIDVFFVFVFNDD